MANVEGSGLLSPSQAARRADVSAQWLVALARAGRLPSIETPLGRLFREADIEAYARSRAADRIRPAAAQGAA